jgi:hypothetical protein
MRRTSLVAFFAALGIAAPALAGAPLKGVDVKLGKNPGGSPAARTTDAAGHADFGAVSAGDYTLTIAAPAGGAHVRVTGLAGAVLERDVAGAANVARAAAIALKASGTGDLVVTVTAPDARSGKARGL